MYIIKEYVHKRDKGYLWDRYRNKWVFRLAVYFIFPWRKKEKWSEIRSQQQLMNICSFYLVFTHTFISLFSLGFLVLSIVPNERGDMWFVKSLSTENTQVYSLKSTCTTRSHNIAEHVFLKFWRFPITSCPGPM